MQPCGNGLPQLLQIGGVQEVEERKGGRESITTPPRCRRRRHVGAGPHRSRTGSWRRWWWRQRRQGRRRSLSDPRPRVQWGRPLGRRTAPGLYYGWGYM